MESQRKEAEIGLQRWEVTGNFEREESEVAT